LFEGNRYVKKNAVSKINGGNDFLTSCVWQGQIPWAGWKSQRRIKLIIVSAEGFSLEIFP